MQPSRCDVLSGQGRKNHTHPGNIRYCELLDAGERKFLLTDNRLEKQMIVRDIIHEIRSKGEFLVYNPRDKTWRVMNNEDVYAKVSQALRYRKRLVVKSHPEQSKTSQSAPSLLVATETSQARREIGRTEQQALMRGRVSRHRSPLSNNEIFSPPDLEPTPIEDLAFPIFPRKKHFASRFSPFSLEQNINDIFADPKPFTKQELAQVLEMALNESSQLLDSTFSHHFR